ncbi:hypothetical protein P280DRAFT_472760 [Massarina eburnea CBS 473.64]|uniref:Apple domain-containing protein n=1 Tax=Massarina eburnea CBS 473.64 TaxID=1395130 RepID=A0A6A6RNX1_9PLEO|nr:hypothetical protein P280DRAFT_472760 [Massarina eburnea CBS 473.64]
MLTTTTIFTSFVALTTALPALNHPRAGGPSILPIPSNCTITNPSTAADTPSAFLPVASTSSARLYSAYYPSFTTNKTQMSAQCLQQCYGYGNHTQCKASFWAENVKVPPGYHDSPGGQLMTSCLLYNRTLTANDFESAPEGEGTDAYTRNLECPAPTTPSGGAQRRWA